jgi:hypothetical protein
VRRRAAARSVRDRNLCPCWRDANGTRHLRLPNGRVFSADETKLAQLLVDAARSGDEWHLAVIERMTTREEREIAADLTAVLAARG